MPRHRRADSATLNASVNPNGAATRVYFNWGTDVSYGNQTDEQQIGYGTSSVPVTANLTTLAQGITYHYQIVAINIAGTTYGNDMNFTILPAPSNLTATTISSSQVNLSWANNSNNETGFEIERKTGAGEFSPIATVNAGATSYSDTGLLPGTIYYYRIRAYTDDAYSTYSNEANIALAPTAVTGAATNVNGASATLNATVNPNGAETTVCFEYGTSTSYGTLTPAQLIETGTDNVTVSADITGLSINTTYHYRVVAVNGVDTTNGDDVMFTTPPITLTITAPLNEDTINRPDVMVKGTIANTSGNETGVTVNGLIGMLYSNQFVVNHVPLTNGVNTISVTATDTEGNTATTAITITAVTTSTYIRLNANPESGVAPLDSIFRIDGSFSVTNPLINATGPATVENLISANPDEYVYRMTVEGIYFFTASATGPDNMQYQDTAGIVVYNQSQLDTVLRSIWTAMTNKLSIGDKTGALQYMSSVTRPNYEQILNAISNQLPSMMATQQELNFIYATNNMAKYELVTLESGSLYSYEVTFIKDENGIWKILQY